MTIRSLCAAVLALLLLLAACRGPDGRSTPTPPQPGIEATTGTAVVVTAAPGPTESTSPATASSALATVRPGTATPATVPQTGAASTAAPAGTGTPLVAIADPVLGSDFPDPDVLTAGGTYYGYATNANGKNIQVAHSTDLQHWDLLPRDALPALPAWAQPGGSLVWAPGVIQIGQRFVLYYTARDLASNKQCIGVAVGDRPEGKFRDASTKPLVCQADLGGSIDPDPFQDRDKLYLYWKNDGNCCGIPTDLWVQELAADGLTLTGRPQSLTKNSQAWEGNLVEAPFMYRHGGHYYLFFSANDYASLNYAVGYATCTSATGPCQQAPENPILQSRMTQPLLIGPGGESLLDANGQTWLFFHAWDVVGGTRGDARYMWLARVDWRDGKPMIVVP
jgi:beta-xylosidase